jgi:hypothetical protein
MFNDKCITINLKLFITHYSIFIFKILLIPSNIFISYSYPQFAD